MKKIYWLVFISLIIFLVVFFLIRGLTESRIEKEFKKCDKEQAVINTPTAPNCYFKALKNSGFSAEQAKAYLKINNSIIMQNEFWRKAYFRYYVDIRNLTQGRWQVNREIINDNLECDNMPWCFMVCYDYSNEIYSKCFNSGEFYTFDSNVTDIQVICPKNGNGLRINNEECVEDFIN